MFVLCCPEAILGGLADFSNHPGRLAIRTDDGQLASVLAPLASETVTSIDHNPAERYHHREGTVSIEADLLGAFEEHSPDQVRELLAAGVSPTEPINE